MKKVDNILILAGGVSERFWPLGDKQLISFLGQPLVEHQATFFSRFGQRVIIVANSKNFLSIKKATSRINFPIKVVVQESRFPGMAGAVFSAHHLLKGSVLIVNGDDLFDESLIVNLLGKVGNDNQLVIPAKKVVKYFPGGYLRLNADKKLLGIVEKPSPEKLPSSLIRLVADYFMDVKPLVNYIRTVRTDKDDLYEQALSMLIKEGKVDYFVVDGYWQPIKYPWQMLKAMRYFFRQAYFKKRMDKAAIFLGKNVRLGKFVKIVGPTYIGDNTVIGDFVLIRESNIGANCLIGAHSEVARSYFGRGVMIHRNYVGDSVFGINVMMGAGAVTANFRFDAKTVRSRVKKKKVDSGLDKLGAIVGKESKLGVNSILFPGVKIGRGSFIAPGEIIREDVDDNRFILKTKSTKNKLVYED